MSEKAKLPEGMVAWAQGDAWDPLAGPPADWTGGKVLTRQGKLRPIHDEWRWSNRRYPRKPGSDIIAYPARSGDHHDA